MHHEYEHKTQKVGPLTAVVAGEPAPWDFDMDPRKSRERFETLVMWGQIGHDYVIGDDVIGSRYERPDFSVECTKCGGTGWQDIGTKREDVRADEECTDCEGEGEVPATIAKAFAESYDAAVTVMVRVSDYGGGSPLHLSIEHDDEDADGACFLTKKQVQDEWGGNVEMARGFIESVLREFADYLRGEVYYWAVDDEHGHTLAAVHGFIGDDGAEYALTEAIAEAEGILAEREREADERAYWNSRDVETVA